MLVFILMAM